MADTKTSAESAASALTGAELIRGVQAGGMVKILISQILDYLVANTGSFRVRPDITTHAGVRALTTTSLTRPTVFLFLIGGAWESWTFRAKSGEVDDDAIYLIPADTATGVFVKTPII